VILFLKRLWQRPPALRLQRADDSAFYATQFVDQHAETQLYVHWAHRAPDLAAQPYDASLGVLSLVRLMIEDRGLAAFGAEQLSVLGGYFEYAKLDTGKQVIGQDEQGDFLMIVLQGMLAETRLQPSGEGTRLGEARPGDLLGDLTALDGETRVSSWTALAPVTLAVLGAQTMDRMMLEDPRLAAALLAWLGKRASLRLRQANARLGAQLPRQHGD
jgi:CRP/FNR family transcriptional regulator, cyclic AMP receptor protein